MICSSRRRQGDNAKAGAGERRCHQRASFGREERVGARERTSRHAGRSAGAQRRQTQTQTQALPTAAAAAAAQLCTRAKKRLHRRTAHHDDKRRLRITPPTRLDAGQVPCGELESPSCPRMGAHVICRRYAWAYSRRGQLPILRVEKNTKCHKSY